MRQGFGQALLGRIGGAMSVIALFAHAAAPQATARLLLVDAGYRVLYFSKVALRQRWHI